jgi:cell division transport system permease protein
MIASLLFAPAAAWQNFWRNKGLSLFAVSVMTVVLMMTGVSLVLGHSFNEYVDYAKSRASTISVYVADTTPLQNVYNLDLRLMKDPRVRSVTYVSKNQALVHFKQFQDVPKDFVENIQGNPLPASLDVDAKDIRYLDAISHDVNSVPLLDKEKPTNYEQEVIGKLVLVSRFLAIVGAAVLIGLTAVSVFIIMMSIRTAVFVRRKEIEVMKLVGATDWFVRGPFLLEGMMAGGLAALASIALVAGGYRPFVDKFRASLPIIPLSYDAHFIGELSLVLALAGLVLGAFGSYLGVRRFLSA